MRTLTTSAAAIGDVPTDAVTLEALQDLAASETRYRRLFETAQDGILILDVVSRKIVDANPFIKMLLGYTHSELLGKELWEIGLFDDIVATQEAFRELTETGYIRYEHLPLVTRGGARVEVEFVSNVYRAADRDVIQCNIRDITSRSGLEQRAREQGAALADLHRRKDEFLAMLSHELRNPLSSIVNALQLMRLQRGDESLLQLQARTILERQVAQLSRLVDDLFEVSRVAIGRLRLRLETVDLRGVVEQTVELLRRTSLHKEIVLVERYPDEPVAVFASAGQIKQVLLNLVTNAVQAMGESGEIAIELTQEGSAAVLRVRDTGPGVESDVIDRIFDPFFTTKRELGGTGLGLALSQSIADAHGGTLTVASPAGGGAEFTLRIPLEGRRDE